MPAPTLKRPSTRSRRRHGWRPAPVTAFFGEAVVLDLSDAAVVGGVDLARVQAAAERSGGVRPGDIVLMRFDWDRRNATSAAIPPTQTPDALRWLVDQGITLLGIDSPGLEEQGNRGSRQSSYPV